MRLSDMVFDTSMNNRPDEWEPEDIFSKPLPPGKAGGPAVDDQAVHDLAVYSYAQCVDCPDELQEKASMIAPENVRETWNLVVEFSAWRQAYVSQKLDVAKASGIIGN